LVVELNTMLDLEEFYENRIKKLPVFEVLFKKLKKTKPKNLDDTFHVAHREVFDEIDCLTCANCCKTTSPLFFPVDIERLAKSMRMTPYDFEKKYLKVDEDGDTVLQSSPCPFLDYENYCTVYADRPNACREYPHTDRKKMYQILDLTLKNTQLCPPLLRVTEKLEKIYK